MLLLETLTYQPSPGERYRSCSHHRSSHKSPPTHPLPAQIFVPLLLLKVGKPSKSKHNILPSGSLQFLSLSKEDHGEWECVATNVVTSITASTRILVIGTETSAQRSEPILYFPPNVTAVVECCMKKTSFLKHLASPPISPWASLKLH